MSINPETDIVASSYDATSHTHSYTVERGGKRWTVQIPDADFEQFGAIMGASGAQNRMSRRKHLVMRFQAAMDGPHDA